MLKKSMKAVLTVAAIASVSTVAMAEAKVSGSAKAYWGQYNSGSEGASAYFATANESNLWLKGSKGNMSYSVEYEQRDGNTDADQGRVALSYKMDKLKFTIGEIVTGVQYSVVSGSKTSGITGWGVYQGLTTYHQGKGAAAAFDLGDGMNVSLTLYGTDAYGTGDSKSSAGSASVVSFNGKFGQLGVKVASVAGTKDDYSKDTDDAEKSSKLLVGVKFDIDSKMSASFDSATKTFKNAAGTKDSVADTALQFNMSLNEDAAIKATYAMRETKSADEKFSSNTYLTAIYDVKVAEGAGIHAIYGTDAIKYEAETTTNANKTASFIGAGFYTSF